MAAQPGWFPDPGGQPGMYRYWDGSAWTDRLSDDPASAPAVPDGGPTRGGQRKRLVWLVPVGVLVLALAAFLLWPQVTGQMPSPTSYPSPTVSAWDETTRPTPTTTNVPTAVTRETSLPCPRYDEAIVDGRLYGGGLSVPVIDDAHWKVNAARKLPWAVCATGLQRRIGDAWVSEVILAGIQPRSLLGTLHQQADAIAEDSLNRFYDRDRGRFVPGTSQAIRIDGLDAWELRYQVLIDYLPGISGDNLNVVVAQHPNGSRSALLTFATIGDDQTQRLVDGARSRVRVEKR